MKDSKRLTVGFLIHRLDNDYAKALLKGAGAKAAELDVNLVIFPGRSLNSQLDDLKYTEYEYQNNVIYGFVSGQALDAVIISAGTLGSFVTKEEFRKFVQSYEDVPIITTEAKVGDFPCIKQSGSGIADLVKHLVNQHGRKKIAFVSGPKNNPDAAERLNYYRLALEECGMTYDPELVAYGKFSEYCVDLVGKLIDDNPDIDAICFANDMMCKGGMTAIKQRGLTVGKDIAVTGYDDSEIATVLKPMLTTVRADASILGARAVEEAVQLVNTGLSRDINLPSYPVYRQSCGGSFFAEEGVHGVQQGAFSAAELAKRIISQHVGLSDSDETPTEFSFELTRFLEGVIDFAVSDNEVDYEAFVSQNANTFSALIDKYMFVETEPEALLKTVKSMQKHARKLGAGKTERVAAIYRLTELIIEQIAIKTVSRHYAVTEDMTANHFLICNIAKDMTMYGNDEEKSYLSIVNNLRRAHLDSVYIYTYQNPIAHTVTSTWSQPEFIQLKAYGEENKAEIVKKEHQTILSYEFFNNAFTPDRRRTVVISPLFSNEEQFGIIVSEMDNEYFPYIYSIAPQICTAIKLTRLVAQLQNLLKAEVSRSDKLNQMSMCDELTGAFNRRGFYTLANKLITAPENQGKHAALIFCDLDNLKKINDNFGHDDGDFAITKSADFLRSSFRQADIVARIGGDEFAVFAICESSEVIKKIPTRIKEIAAKFNKNSDKPYNVTVSVGVYEFDCGKEKKIQDYMDKADTALYDDKKYKPRDIMKEALN